MGPHRAGVKRIKFLHRFILLYFLTLKIVVIHGFTNMQVSWCLMALNCLDLVLCTILEPQSGFKVWRWYILIWTVFRIAITTARFKMWIGYEIVVFKSGLMLSKDFSRKSENIFKDAFTTFSRYFHNYIKMIFSCLLLMLSWEIWLMGLCMS